MTACAPGEAPHSPGRRRPATLLTVDTLGRAGLDQLRPLAEQLPTGLERALTERPPDSGPEATDDYATRSASRAARRSRSAGATLIQSSSPRPGATVPR